MILITESYEPSDPVRKAELAECTRRNALLGLFDTVASFAIPKERLRYGVVFRQCAERWPGKVCVLANADIWFDHSAARLREIVRRNRMVTLTRWDNESSPLMWGYVRQGKFFSGTQDAWAFVGGDFVGIGESIPLGFIGCDQAILGEVVSVGAEIVNPALTIRAHHLHSSRPEIDDRQGISGTYVYPELTTMRVMTGDYITHPMPATQQ